VLPALDVAVAVTIWPALAANGGIVALPSAPVFTLTVLRNAAPSPFPDASQVWLRKK
jgi:hypothetical protein